APAHPALAVLRELPGVADAALVEREGLPPLAYAAPDPGAAPGGVTPTGLRLALRSALAGDHPELVPEYVVLVDALPRTGTGEADPGRLPGDFPVRAGTRVRLTGTRARTVLAAFAELLGGHPGPDADFFVLGGHSLLAVQLAERLRERLRLPLTGLDIMEHRTPRALTGLLDARARERDAAVAAPGGPARPPADRGTVLVTGATGGVGAFVTRELAARGYAVRALVRAESAHLAAPGTEVVEGDLRATGGLREAAEGAVAVVHAACTFTDHDLDRAAMRALLDGWRRGPFVFVSSTDAYAAPGEAPSAYGRAKRDCERMLLEAGAAQAGER
ncbi:NAD(P)H-binding protein, partial [Streptomyces boncukensis]